MNLQVYLVVQMVLFHLEPLGVPKTNNIIRHIIINKNL